MIMKKTSSIHTLAGPDPEYFLRSHLDCDQSFKFSFGSSLRIGSCELVDKETGQVYTGCTIFYLNKSNKTAVSIQGGSASTYNTGLKMLRGDATVDVIVFTGGSVLGLPTVVTGVNQYLMKEKIPPGERVHASNIPRVTGAVIYDYIYRKDNLFPTQECGYLAVKDSVPNMIVSGQHGAGSNSHVGKIIDIKYAQKGGQGVSFTELPNGIKIFVCVVLNSVGAIYNNGHIIRGNFDSESQQFVNSDKLMDSDYVVDGNTTLTFICVNQILTGGNLTQLANTAHINMARSIYPFSTLGDGDTLFLTSTMERTADLSYDDLQVFYHEVNAAVEKAILSQFV